MNHKLTNKVNVEIMIYMKNYNIKINIGYSKVIPRGRNYG